MRNFFLIILSLKIDGILAAIFYMIHALLLPTTSTQGSDKTMKKYSVHESRNAFMVFYETDTAYVESLNAIRNVQSIPPMINIIGDVFSPKKAYVDYDNVRYEFHSLAKAIDIAFKAYFTLMYVYPKACQAVWIFINQYFYDLEDEESKPSAANGLLMHEMTGNSIIAISILFLLNNVFVYFLL